MIRKGVLWPALLGLAACAHGSATRVAPAPVAPAAAATPAPVPAPAAPSPVAPEPVPDTAQHAVPPSGPPTPADTTHPVAVGQAPVVPAPIPSAIRDTASDEAFLDSLHALTADSAIARKPAAPGAAAGRAPVQRAPLAPEPMLAAVAVPPAAAPVAATWDIDIDKYATNERVQYYLDYFRGRARDHFEVYLARLGRYEGLVRAKLLAARMPQDMVYLAVIESGMNPNAVSRRRAVGMWQFIAGTARRYGLTVDPWVDERRDPWASTDAAIRMLSELENRFGSLYLAAAAYDAGPGKIQRGLNRYDFGTVQGNDLYFALADERFLRRETRDYVPKLIAAAMLAKEPAKWGFTGIQPWQPLRYDSIRVHDAVGLDVLARLADTTQDAMEDLNPQLVRRVTPPGRTVWVRVPVGRGDSATARLAVLPPDRRLTHVEHWVARGETLGRIALNYHVSVEDILGANRGLRARALRIGQRLVIPTSGVRSARRALYAEATSRRRASREPRYLLSTTARLPATAQGSGRVHVVREGESAWTISRRYQIPLDELLKSNGLTRRSLIKPGQSLRIPS